MPAPLSPLIVRMRHAIEGCRPIQIRGRVTQVTGTLLKAVVPGVRIGELCQLRNPDQSLAAGRAVRRARRRRLPGSR
ncbi:hypothetical protein ACLBVR_31430, partial [Pseudomonas aeruginosa]